MPWGLDNEWRITDQFSREWRFWIVSLEERSRTPRTTTSRREPGCPIFHLVYYAFNESRVVDIETATSLAEIYDALTGADVSQRLARSVRDPRQRVRGIERELEQLLYQAVELGALKFERYEVPWPFPEPDEQPPSRRKHGPPKEEDSIVEYPFSM